MGTVINWFPSLEEGLRMRSLACGCGCRRCAVGACDITVSTNTRTDGPAQRNETDVDCGGSCAACADGRACVRNTDCTMRRVRNRTRGICGAPVVTGLPDSTGAQVYNIDPRRSGIGGAAGHAGGLPGITGNTGGTYRIVWTGEAAAGRRQLSTASRARSGPPDPSTASPPAAGTIVSARGHRRHRQSAGGGHRRRRDHVRRHRQRPYLDGFDPRPPAPSRSTSIC